MTGQPCEQDAVSDLEALVQRVRQDRTLARVCHVVVDASVRPVTVTVRVRRGWWRTRAVVFTFPDGLTTLDVERAVESAAANAGAQA